MLDQVKLMFGHVPEKLEDMAFLSQFIQAEAFKYFIESARARAFRRTGIIWWNMLDGWPQISDAVVDYYFTKKLAYHYIRRVQRPICLMMDELVDWTHDVVLGLRAVKDEGEIARLKAAQAITDAAFSYIIGFIKPGMTEREVQLELENFMLRHGAEDVAFRSIVATGENGADPHAVPGATKLEAGQCVVMDFGAKLRGYCSDMTRMVFLGEPDAKKADAYRVLRHANETVEAALVPDMTGKEAHELAERLLAEGGYAGKMGHGLGHGVGIEVHELPLLNARYDTPLAPGNVVTVEPGIYLPGEFGMRLEDFGVITKTGYEVFTQSTHEMVVL